MASGWTRSTRDDGQPMSTADIPWDQPATMIDLEGRAPIIGTIRDCAMHFAIYKPHAKEQARVLLTRLVHRPGRVTRTWILEPNEIEELVVRMRRETN